MTFRSGRHFLQIPGPTNVPDRVLRAMDRPTMDHRGPGFALLGREVLEGMKAIFGTAGEVFIFPASGTGAWEAALVNTLSPGDRVLMAETGQFAMLWQKLATRLGLAVELLPGDWRHGANPAAIEQALAADRKREIKAVCVVHNETSTGAVTLVPQVRAAMNRVGHPALLMVDTISSLDTETVVEQKRAEVTVDRHTANQRSARVGADHHMIQHTSGCAALAEIALPAQQRGGIQRNTIVGGKLVQIDRPREHGGT